MMILNNDDGDNDDNDEIDTASVVFADVVGDGACDYNNDNDNRHFQPSGQQHPKRGQRPHRPRGVGALQHRPRVPRLPRICTSPGTDETSTLQRCCSPEKPDEPHKRSECKRNRIRNVRD